MQKTVKFAIFSVAFMPALSFAQTSSLSDVIARTDVQLAASVNDAKDIAAAPSVPAPVAVEGKTNATRPQSDHFPLDKHIVLVYEYTSSEFAGSKTIRLEQMAYFPKDNAASFLKTTTYNGSSYNEIVGVHADAAGVYSRNGLLGGDRMEFSLPERVGSTWSRNSDGSTITSLSAAVRLPAGEFSDCLKVTTELGGGDAGLSERYYAPGIGLVYENVSGEAVQETLRLVSYRAQ